MTSEPLTEEQLRDLRLAGDLHGPEVCDCRDLDLVPDAENACDDFWATVALVARIRDEAVAAARAECEAWYQTTALEAHKRGEQAAQRALVERAAQRILNTVDPSGPAHEIRMRCVEAVRDLAALAADPVETLLSAGSEPFADESGHGFEIPLVAADPSPSEEREWPVTDPRNPDYVRPSVEEQLANGRPPTPCRSPEPHPPHEVPMRYGTGACPGAPSPSEGAAVWSDVLQSPADVWEIGRNAGLLDALRAHGPADLDKGQRLAWLILTPRTDENPYAEPGDRIALVEELDALLDDCDQRGDTPEDPNLVKVWAVRQVLAKYGGKEHRWPSPSEGGAEEREVDER